MFALELIIVCLVGLYFPVFDLLFDRQLGGNMNTACISICLFVFVFVFVFVFAGDWVGT